MIVLSTVGSLSPAENQLNKIRFASELIEFYSKKKRTYWHSKYNLAICKLKNSFSNIMLSFKKYYYLRIPRTIYLKY